MDETRDGKSAVFVSREIDVLDSKILFWTYLLTEELRNEGCCCCFWASKVEVSAGRPKFRPAWDLSSDWTSFRVLLALLSVRNHCQHSIKFLPRYCILTIACSTQQF